MQIRNIVLIAAIVMIYSIAGFGQQPEFEFVDLSAQLPGSTDSAAFDISPAGYIVGTARIGGGETVVARWTGGSGETVDSIYGSEYSQGINDAGVIVGTFVGTGTGWYFRDQVFDCIPLPDPCGSFNNLWRASSGHDINADSVFTGAISPDADQPANDPIEAYLGSFAADGTVMIERLGDYLGLGTTGTGLNDAVEVVGVAGGSLDWTALLFRDGHVIPLPDLGGSYNWAEEINNEGFATGIASQPDPGPWPYDAEAVVWDTRAEPITVTPLGKLPGHRLSRALSLNESGIVVGFSVDADFLDQRAVLWIDQQIQDLNQLLPPGSDWHLEVATAVNESSSIVGYGRRAGLPGRRAFLLRPVAPFASDFEIGHLGEWSVTVAPTPSP